MKLGVHMTNTRAAGGQIQVLLMMLEALHSADSPAEVCLISFDDGENLSEKYKKSGWQHIDLRQELSLEGEIESKRSLAPDISAILKDRYSIDLLLLPTWTDGGQHWGVPFIFTVHDVQHRLQPEFPEVSVGAGLGSSWRWREQLFTESTTNARGIIVDSEEGKRNILEFYDVAPEKIFPLPRCLPPAMRQHQEEAAIQAARAKFSLPERYAFYPAQLWPHKNHYRIVEAAGFLKKEHGVDIPLVFVGGQNERWGVLDVCQALTERYAIEENFYYLGYLADEDMAALFAGAQMLVMPTFFGPTNIPYLEAFHHKVPTIASDLPGIREQVGTAALLVDPRDSKQLAEHMLTLWKDEVLCGRLREEGVRRLEAHSPGVFQERLMGVIAACGS